MKNVGYYNGTIDLLENIRIPVLDRAVYFGDGVYEACVFGNRKIFALEDHMDRFFRSCAFLKIEIPYKREELVSELQKCIDAYDEDHGMLYWQLSRGTYPRQHGFPPADTKANLMAQVTPFELTGFDYRYKLITVPDQRYTICNIKTINRVPNVLAYNEAKEHGCGEVVFHRNGRVTEGTFSNIVIIKNGSLIVPPTDQLILPGITMKHAVHLCKEIGIPVAERAFTVEEVKTADEVLVTSTGVFCIRADELDGEPVGMKDPLHAEALQQAYMDFYRKDIR